MAWPKSNEPKNNNIAFRASDRQLQILRDYVQLKGLDNDGDGLRRMIDGAEAWVTAQKSQGAPQATVNEPAASHQAAEASHQERPEHHIVEGDEAHSGQVSLGYIGGRLDVGLPGSDYMDDGESLPGDAE